MDSTTGLSTNQKSLHDKFKNISKKSCFKCGKSTVPAAYGDPESDYRAVENKTGVLKYGGKTKGKNYYCKTCGVFVD
jgi:hypothetical protein